jgi:glycosyltransferase involved in cell wall biosynthesis
MKIVLCKGQLFGPISGADETLVTYAIQLQKLGHAVSVLLLYPCSPLDHHYQRLREAGVPVAAVASNSVRKSLGAGRTVLQGLLDFFPTSRRLIRNRAQQITTNLAGRYQQQCYDSLRIIKPDVVHVVTPDSGAMVMIRAAHAAGIPVIYQELGIPYHPPDFESYYEQFTSVLPLCSEVAALSPLLAQQCQARLTHTNGFSVLPITTDDLRNGHSALRNSSTSVVVGFAARIEHLKGPMILLDAFARVSQTCQDLRLSIAGTGSLEQKVMARARALGVASRCEFVGVYTRPEQRKAFMERLDIFALPSLTEGTPNTIVEAMSHGVPTIASAVGGIPDLINSETGILFPPGDEQALGNAMARLAKDAGLRKKMGRAAREKYEQVFAPNVVLPLLLDFYQRVIEGHSAGNNGARPPPRDISHPWSSAERFEATRSG